MTRTSFRSRAPMAAWSPASSDNDDAVIFATLSGGWPNRLTAIAFSRITFVPTHSGGFTEPGLVQYLAVSARVMTEAEAFSLALARVDELSDISAAHNGERVRAPSVIVVDIGAMPGGDRRLMELVSCLPAYRSQAITCGRVALKATVPALGRVPGVVGRAELINAFNARAVPIQSEDVTDPARTPGKFIPSFRQYQSRADTLSKDEVRSSLSAAERLDPKRILDRDEALVALDDNEVIAAAVMLSLVAGDTYAPAGGGGPLNDQFRNWRIRGLA